MLGMNLVFAFIAVSASSLGASAATPDRLPVSVKPAKQILLDSTRTALAQPLETRLKLLTAQGDAGYRGLVGLMFDKSASIETRWRATAALGRVAGQASLPELEHAMARSQPWFLKNAALVAMAAVDRPSTLRWARILIGDSALVVRAAAVDKLKELGDTASAGILWRKLYSRENYHGGESLFIRKRILETLASFDVSGDEKRFAYALSDSDAALHPVAISALERMTGRNLGTAKDTLATKRSLWLKWASQHARM